MEERVGERRYVFSSNPSPCPSPHSFLAGRGEEMLHSENLRKKIRLLGIVVERHGLSKEPKARRIFPAPP